MIDTSDYKQAYKIIIEKLNVERDYYNVNRDVLGVCAYALEHIVLERDRYLNSLQEDNYERD